ncbi:MAG: hypothetical protein RMM58_06225 [Chloroflexota bacterium]|nr:hypothetical protein [Dehalococcoidia bacterium]MDW8253458.1 hypothetical protein [Chloroflexota bacterium]
MTAPRDPAAERASRLAGMLLVLGLAAIVSCALLAFGLALARPDALAWLRPRHEERVLELPVGPGLSPGATPVPPQSPTAVPAAPTASPPALPTATPTPSQYYITCQDGRLIIGTAIEGACAGNGGILSISLTPPNAPPRPASNAPLSFLVVQSAAPGGQAAVTVQTVPGASCAITVILPNGEESPAAGLNNQAADRLGRASWRWTIPPSSPTGVGKVRVTCGASSAEADLPVGR